MISLNQIVDQFKNFTSEHAIINGIGYGDASQFKEHNSKGDIQYPYVFVNDLGANANFNGLTGAFEYNFRLIFADIVKKDRSNELEVISDMTRVAVDYMNAMRNPSYFDLNENAFIPRDANFNLTNFTEDYQDRLSGVYFDITIRTDLSLNECEIPVFENDTPLDPLVVQWADDNNVLNPLEINALNDFYVSIKTMLETRGSGEIRYLLSVSPTSYQASIKPLVYQDLDSVLLTDPNMFNPSLGHDFQGTYFGQLGNLITGIPSNQLLAAYVRTSPQTNNSACYGIGNNGLGQKGFAAYTRPLGFFSGAGDYNIFEYNLTSYDFSSSGTWINYNDGSSYGYYKNKIWQPPNNPNLTLNSWSGLNRFGYGCINIGGTYLTPSNDSCGAFMILDDGGQLFNSSEIQIINDSITNYNNSIR